MSRHDQHERSQPSNSTLPFSAFLPFVAGIAAGLLMRFVFSKGEGDPLSVMSGAFVFGAPLLIGAVTVFVAERLAPRGLGYYAASGALAVILFIFGTMLIMIEGLICAALISPLFALLGAVGGLIMGAACRLARYTMKALHSFLLLPLLLMAFEVGTELPTRIYAIERSTVINAPRQVVWRQLQSVPAIDEREVEDAWVFRIGVPVPQSATPSRESVPARRITMGKHVYFDQVIEDSRENEFVRWSYRFYGDSFPARAMDDHVRIGGSYFDLIDTSYTLLPEGSQTRLIVRFQYRLSTRFNWYAGPVLQHLLENAADTYLDLYRDRASRAAAMSAAMRLMHHPL
jgi:hypothetical protein